MNIYIHVHVLMRDERRKEETSKQDQTNNKAKQHSTPKAVTFPKKNELPQVHVLVHEHLHVYTCTCTCIPIRGYLASLISQDFNL